MKRRHVMFRMKNEIFIRVDVKGDEQKTLEKHIKKNWKDFMNNFEVIFEEEL